MFGRNAEQITSLGEAIPSDKFTYAPAEGVRDVGDVLLHVASLNYFVARHFDVELPEDIDPSTIEDIEGKEAIMEATRASFEFAKSYLPEIDANTLDEEVELSFGTFSKRQLLLILYEHSGEHKGQLIAYARANGITPPWSQ